MPLSSISFCFEEYETLPCKPVDLVGAMRKMSPGLSGSAGEGGAAARFSLISVGKSMLFFHMLNSVITKRTPDCVFKQALGLSVLRFAGDYPLQQHVHPPKA